MDMDMWFPLLIPALILLGVAAAALISRKSAEQKPRALASRGAPSSVTSRAARVGDKMDVRTLYERLGGVYGISKVVTDFSNRVLDSDIVGRNSQNVFLRDWSRNKAVDRLPGLIHQRIDWLSEVSGGPQRYVPTVPGREHLSLEMAHCPLQITRLEFDEVAHILRNTLFDNGVSGSDTSAVLDAFAARKLEIILGSRAGGRCLRPL